MSSNNTHSSSMDAAKKATVVFHRPNAGTHTVEGSVAGSRAVALQAQREKDQQAFEEKQAAIRNRSKHLSSSTMFATSNSNNNNKSNNNKSNNDMMATAAAASLGITTTGTDSGICTNAAMIGLVSAQDFIAMQKAAENPEKSNANDEEVEKEKVELSKEEKKALRQAKKKRQRQEQKVRSTLSFAGCEDGDDDEEDNDAAGDDDDDKAKDSTKKSKTSNSSIGISSGGGGGGGGGWTKDPTVDTSFLPDKQRDAAQQLQRKVLQNQWQREQERVKQERLEITYSYWDGSGHRRTVTCRKGDTVGAFLNLVLHDLRLDFRQLTGLASDDLLYVKEDLILPSDITFYDLIATKARGKSGPLFHFDVHDDVRVGPVDLRVEKDESHPGKVVQRQWYDRSKHIFPASRWELYDPSKEYGTYTIGGGIVQPTKKNK